jgi:MFS family permease
VPAPTHKRRTLAFLVLVYAFSVVDRQILAILNEPLRRDLRLTDTQFGFLSGFAFVLFYTTFGIPIARWADRGVRTRIITLSLALFSAMTAACGLAATFWHLALARVGVGIGEATANVISLGLGPQIVGILSDVFRPAYGPDSLCYGLLSVSPLGLWGAYHYYLAGRALARDLAGADEAAA